MVRAGLINNYNSNLMMDIDVKDALTGHSSSLSLDPAASCHHLMLLIQKNYVVEARDQMVLTRGGKMVREDHIVGELFSREEVANDRTYVKGPDGRLEEKIPGVYVFNRKDL